MTPINKIYKTFLKKLLTKISKRFNLFYDNQFAFREKHSTTLAITHLYEILLQYKDNDDVACRIFLDRAKTFDSVDHKILIDKLEHYGVRGNGIKLLKSYLTNRKQYFSTNDNGSKKIFVATGLPQDSVLGPFFV